MNKICFIIFSLCLLLSTQVTSQDFHFSQFTAMPTLLNPALTGDTDEKTRLIAGHRSQWSEVLKQDAYKTYALSVDGRKDLESGNYWGFGFSGSRDTSGELDFKSTQGNFSLSYGLSFFRQDSVSHFLVLAGQVGIVQRKVDPSAGQFPYQYPYHFEYPPVPSLPGFNQKFIHSDINAGVIWISRWRNRKSLTLGLAAFHLNRPNVSFFRTRKEIRLDYKIVLHMGAELPISPLLSILPNLNYLQYGNGFSMTAGSSIKLVSQNFSLPSYFLCGVYHRAGSKVTGGFHSDAIIFVSEISLDQNSIGISYDHTVSELRQAGLPLGTVELFFRYTISHKKKTQINFSEFQSKEQ